MSDNLVPIGGSWGAAECLVCGRSWKLEGPIETEVPRCPSGCYDEALQGDCAPDTPDDAIAKRDAEITALRAALDQERADNEKLRHFATDIIEAVCAVDVDGHPVGPLSDEIVLGMAIHRGLLHSPGWPTALLSGRGEGQADG